MNPDSILVNSGHGSAGLPVSTPEEHDTTPLTTPHEEVSLVYPEWSTTTGGIGDHVHRFALGVVTDQDWRRGVE